MELGHSDTGIVSGMSDLFWFHQESLKKELCGSSYGRFKSFIEFWSVSALFIHAQQARRNVGVIRMFDSCMWNHLWTRSPGTMHFASEIIAFFLSMMIIYHWYVLVWYELMTYYSYVATCPCFHALQNRSRHVINPENPHSCQSTSGNKKVAKQGVSTEPSNPKVAV